MAVVLVGSARHEGFLDVVGNGCHQAVPSFHTCPSYVRGEVELLGMSCVENRIVERNRLIDKYIQCGTADGVVVNDFCQCSFFDDSAAPHVDDDGCRLHHPELFFSYQSGRAVIVWRMDGNHV